MISIICFYIAASILITTLITVFSLKTDKGVLKYDKDSKSYKLFVVTETLWTFPSFLFVKFKLTFTEYVKHEYKMFFDKGRTTLCAYVQTVFFNVFFLFLFIPMLVFAFIIKIISVVSTFITQTVVKLCSFLVKDVSEMEKYIKSHTRYFSDSFRNDLLKVKDELLAELNKHPDSLLITYDITVSPTGEKLAVFLESKTRPFDKYRDFYNLYSERDVAFVKMVLELISLSRLERMYLSFKTNYCPVIYR